MTTKINADTSGGLKLESDLSGTLELQSAGTTKAKITSSGLQNASGSAITSQAGKNRIINGNMMIDQRNAGASVTPTGSAYTLDRWQLSISVASKLSVQQSSTAPTGFKNSTLITTASAYTASASDYLSYCTKIEGFNVSDLDWGTANAKTVTLSFWVRSSLTGTFSGAIQNSGAGRAYPFTFTISTANTWEYETITIAGDTSGTWLTTNGIGMEVHFNLGSGSDRLGTAGAWNSNWNTGATGSVALVQTASATMNITGVQLEIGTVATPFENLQYGQQLALCQRYYEQNYGTNNYEMKIQGITSGLTNSTFKVSKRANATTTVYSTVTQVAGTVNNGNGNVQTGITSVISGKESFWVVMSGTTSQVYTYYFKSSAEL